MSDSCRGRSQGRGRFDRGGQGVGCKFETSLFSITEMSSQGEKKIENAKDENPKSVLQEAVRHLSATPTFQI